MRVTLLRFYLINILLINILPIVAQPKIPFILVNVFPKNECIAYCTGKFTPKGEQEYLAFYHDIESRFANSISLIAVIGYKNDKIRGCSR